MAKSPYQRIVRAGDRGTGLRLSPEEIQVLSRDTAIRQLASNDDATKITDQCTFCLSCILPPEGWHCNRHKLPPTEQCRDWRRDWNLI